MAEEINPFWKAVLMQHLKISNDVLDKIFSSFYEVQDCVADIIDLPEYLRGEKDLHLTKDRTEVFAIVDKLLPPDLEAKIQIVQDKRDLVGPYLEVCKDLLLAWTCAIRDVADLIDPEHKINF